MSLLQKMGVEARRYRASAGGYFFLPCPLCGNEFGGNEWSGASVRCLKSPSTGHGICPDCEADGRADDPAKFFVLDPQETCPYCRP